MDTDEPFARAGRLLALAPLLVLALVPWLEDRRPANLLTVVVTAAAYAAVLMAVALVDLLTIDGPPVVVVAAMLGLVGSAAAAVTISGTSDADGTLRIIAVLLVLAAAFMVLFQDLLTPGPLFGAAALVVLAVVTSQFVRGAIADDEEREQQTDALIAAGFASAYLPEIDGQRPEQASLTDGDVNLFYDQGGAAASVGVELVSGDFCDEVGATSDDYCAADSTSFGEVGDRSVALRRDDGVAIVVKVYDAPGGVTQEQLTSIEAAASRPLGDLVDLLDE